MVYCNLQIGTKIIMIVILSSMHNITIKTNITIHIKTHLTNIDSPKCFIYLFSQLILCNTVYNNIGLFYLLQNSSSKNINRLLR